MHLTPVIATLGITLAAITASITLQQADTFHPGQRQVGRPGPPGARADADHTQKNTNHDKVNSNSPGDHSMPTKITKSNEEWRKALTPEQYHVMREKGTERAFTGKYWKTKTPGVYLCAACGQSLFDSEQKFDSGTGWPSFWKPISEHSVETEQDRALGMTRTEVHCSRCGAHLGHVFNDGPAPTGLRYCLNSASLNLAERKKEDEQAH